MLKDERNTVTVPKSLLCQKIIDEANRAIDFLEAVRAYASAVSLEEIKGERSHQDEECNEPYSSVDFVSCLEKIILGQEGPTAKQLFNEGVIPESKRASSNDWLLFAESPEVVSNKLKELIEHSDFIQFPKEYFKDYIVEDDLKLDDEDITMLKAVLKKLGMPDELVNLYVKKW